MVAHAYDMCLLAIGGHLVAHRVSLLYLRAV